jgi:hypothetical protein
MIAEQLIYPSHTLYTAYKSMQAGEEASDIDAAAATKTHQN